MLFAVTVGLFSVSITAQAIPDPGDFHGPQSSDNYFDHRQMTRFLREIVQNHSDFTTLYTIGQSVKGKELWVLKLQSPWSPALGTPHIKFVGNIHGNEPVGGQLILYLAEYLIKNYEADNEVRSLLDSTIIHLLPSLNPDGFEEAKEGDCFSGPGRRNGNDVDLNRSFPEFLKKNEVEVQPETEAVIRWMTDVQFLLSGSFHGGTLVANYPYDGIFDPEQEFLNPQVSLTPDDDVFKHLALTYSRNHPSMHKERTCDSSQPSFPGGITNGALWYSFLGGMQDYNYIFGGCMELTLEISCCKYPQSKHLPRLWEENKKAMIELSKQAQMGVRGLIADKKTSAYVPNATLRISGRNISFNSTKKGEFWRILLPGNYILIVEAKGYHSQKFPFSVPRGNGSWPAFTWLNVFLQPMNDTATDGPQTSSAGGTPHFFSFNCIIFYWIIFFWFSSNESFMFLISGSIHHSWMNPASLKEHIWVGGQGRFLK